MKTIAALARTAAAAVAVLGAVAVPPLVNPQPAAADALWLCHPAMSADACNGPLDTTDLATGATTTPARTAPGDRQVDCFYIYPTVEKGPGLTAPLAVTPDLQGIALAQAARFSPLCRMYAPVYRQVTVPSLSLLWTPAGAGLLQPAYADVEAAWNQYLANDNQGRGVILIGRSQGTMLARKLIHERIDTDPTLRDRLVGAVLLGGNVTTARGSTTGGDFANIPVCTARGQAGCVVAYSTAQSDPEISIVGAAGGLLNQVMASNLGLASGEGYEIACTDPGLLSGDSTPQGLTIPTVLSATDTMMLFVRAIVFPDPLPTAPTTWVTSAARTSGRCTDHDGYRFYTLGPTTNGHFNELPGNQTHLVDMSLGLDRLVSIAEQQAATWLAERRTG